jgi:seryl-tRNA synthetase
MFKIKFRVTPVKKFNKEIEKKILEIVDNLQEKFVRLKREFDYKFISEKTSFVFEITSKAYTATDLIVLFEKQVRFTLGKVFKIGLDDLKIINYEIQTELEEQTKVEISVPFVKKLRIKDNNLMLVYSDIPFSYIKDQYVEKTIKLVKDKIKMEKYEGKDEFRETIWEGKQRKLLYKEDPALDLEKRGWIRRTEAKGQFVYGPEFTALVNVFRELYMEFIFNKMGFKEMIFPKFEPWSIPIKSGHAKNIYPNAYFVCVPKNSDPKEWQNVTDIYAITGEVPDELVKEKSVCVGIMSFAQCPPFWPFLKNKIIDEKSLPFLTYDWSGPTYRNESGGTHGLDRLEEFTRIETLYVGTKEQVVKIWKDLKDVLIKFYDEVLDLEIKVANVTPWWMAHVGIKTESRDSDIGTFDFDAYLPYRGDRNREWLEIQNNSSNGDKYPKSFNVRGKSQEYLWSGCAGASFQRIIVAFLAQKGFNFKDWPREVRGRFEKKIKDIKRLKFY